MKDSLSYLETCGVVSHTGTGLEASRLEDSGIVAFRLIVKLQWHLPFRL
jgi:hypothetical protein